MLKRIVYLIALFICISCVKTANTYDYTSLTPKHLPKETPGLILVGSSAETDIHSHQFGGIDTLSSLGNVSIMSFYMSKHEITNKQFCYFLNQDSIRTNPALLKSIIDLNNIHGRIRLKDGMYAPISGYANYPVVLVSWWGAKIYCKWLTEDINKKRAEKDLYRLPNYRLPAEYEWICATSTKAKISYFIETMCDSIALHYEFPIHAHDVKEDTLNMYGAAGMNENVYEWTEDNFEAIESIMDYSMVAYYNDTITADAVVRKHGLIYNKQIENTCGRMSRTRTGFYGDTGFRIVQTYLGRSTGAEF